MQELSTVVGMPLVSSAAAFYLQLGLQSFAGGNLLAALDRWVHSALCSFNWCVVYRIILFATTTIYIDILLRGAWCSYLIWYQFPSQE